MAATVLAAMMLTSCSSAESAEPQSAISTKTSVSLPGWTPPPPPTQPPVTTVAPPSEGGLLIGTWQSVDDEADLRTFNADGTAIETYPAATTPAQDRWAWVSPESMPRYPDEPIFANGPLLQLVPTDGSNPWLYFAVYFPNPDTLSLVFVSGTGQVLRYTRQS